MYRYSRYFLRCCNALGIPKIKSISYLIMGLKSNKSDYPFISNNLNKYLINKLELTKDGYELSDELVKVHSANYYSLTQINWFIDKYLNSDLSCKCKLNINSNVYNLHIRGVNQRS